MIEDSKIKHPIILSTYHVLLLGILLDDGSLNH